MGQACLHARRWRCADRLCRRVCSELRATGGLYGVGGVSVAERRVTRGAPHCGVARVGWLCRRTAPGRVGRAVRYCERDVPCSGTSPSTHRRLVLAECTRHGAGVRHGRSSATRPSSAAPSPARTSLCCIGVSRVRAIPAGGRGASGGGASRVRGCLWARPIATCRECAPLLSYSTARPCDLPFPCCCACCALCLSEPSPGS